jgi:hypothetical protein
LANDQRDPSHDTHRASEVIRPETDLSAALDEMEREGVNQLPIMAIST